MATKRRPLAFAELEARGRNAILRTAEEVQAEEELLASQHAGMPANQQAGGTSERPGSRTHLPKATYRLNVDALEAMEDMKRILRRQHNIRVSFEDIAEEAILAAYRDLQEKTTASNLVRQLAGKPAAKGGTR